MGRNNICVLSRAVIIDNDQLLVCQTTDLAHNFYFLPGGHIEQGESAEQSLLRELMEEAGAESRIEKFLGCLEYSFEPGHNSICHNHEYNFIFEVSSEALKMGRSIPQLEKHIKLMWIPLSSLTDIDFRPEPLRELLLQWLSKSPRDFFVSRMR